MIQARHIRAIRIGLVGGAVAIYAAVTGILRAFETRELIVDVVGLGRAVLLFLPIFMGYRAARPVVDPAGRVVERRPAEALLLGAIAGAATVALVALFLIVSAAIEMGTVLVQVNESMRELLSFGQGAGTGSLILVAAGAVGGAFGGALTVVPRRARKALFRGLMWVVIFSLAQAFLRTFINNLFFELYLPIDVAWMFGRTGVTIAGAVTVFALAVIVPELWRMRGDSVKQAYGGMSERNRTTAKWIVVAAAIGFLLFLPQILGVFMSEVVGFVGLFILLGLGLNIVVGYAGLLDLGYVAFFAIGAYSAAILTSPNSPLLNPEMNFWFALPIVVVIATISGILIGAPVLRLRGDYLAIVTLGFGEIIRIVVQSNWASPLTGGAQGITRIPDPVVGGAEIDTPQTLYYLLLAFVLLAAFISVRLQDSRVGRAWVAMREDESVAEAMGISIIKYKLLAFATGAAIGCLGGAFFAVKIGSIFPASFGLLVSIQALALIVLGGMGSIPGVVVGALVLVGLPELLREFGEYRLLFYGGILVAIMLIRPEGLVPSARRRAELGIEETPEEQFERRAGDDRTAPVVSTGAES